VLDLLEANPWLRAAVMADPMYIDAGRYDGLLMVFVHAESDPGEAAGELELPSDGMVSCRWRGEVIRVCVLFPPVPATAVEVSDG